MSSPTVEMPAETVVANDSTPVEGPPSSVPTIEAYQKTLLGAAIKAATLLDELMELSIIPDPRVKDAADVALQLVALMNTQASDLATSDLATSDSATTKKKTKAKAS
ncbi:MAG: hypothetical protein AAFP03_06290 [Cyanobacteria bacterium J06598_3]